MLLSSRIGTLILDVKPASSVARATSSVINRGLVLFASDEELSVAFVKRLPSLRSSSKHLQVACYRTLSPQRQ